MPHQFLEMYRSEIERYCKKCGLSTAGVFSSVSAGNKKEMILMHYDPIKGKNGLRDETPMPVTLRIVLENGSLRFEQTEHTYRHLAVHREPESWAAEPVPAYA
jgi:hypothetical protein